LNYRIAHAIAHKKSIFIATLDCRNAFGSEPHKFLRSNLHIPEQLIDVIMDSYKGAAVKIFTLRSTTRDIQIKRGVKQGFPLSPLLFNIAIDPNSVT
jgi:hypothetical protein